MPNLDLNKNVKELTEHFFHYRNVLAYRVKDFSDSSAAVERVVELEGGDDHLNNQVNRDAKIFCVTRIQLVRHVVNDQLKRNTKLKVVVWLKMLLNVNTTSL